LGEAGVDRLTKGSRGWGHGPGLTRLLLDDNSYHHPVTEDRRVESAAAWSDEMAASWERRRERIFERHRRVSEWLVDEVRARPGSTILELAAGTGETGFLAAERVGDTGTLISTDVTPAMVEAARRGAATRGLNNVEFRVMDAERIELADNSVDGVLCRFGLMLMSDPGRVLNQALRVLRSGGRLAYAVWGEPQSNPWAALLGPAIQAAGHPLAENLYAIDGPLFSLADPGRNRELLRRTGFTDVLVTEIAAPRRYDGFDEYWDSHINGPMAASFASLPRVEIEQIRASLASVLSSFQCDGGLEFPSLVVVARAVRDPHG
jgi:ubiquinone/menaquinone biosynthesis C-methylase UbiE